MNRPDKRPAYRAAQRPAMRPAGLAVEQAAEQLVQLAAQPTLSDAGEPRPGPSRPVLSRPDQTRPTFHFEEKKNGNGKNPSPYKPMSRARTNEPSRLTVRSVACVECGAEPGEPCHGRRGYRASNHQTRVESFKVRSDWGSDA